MEASSTNKDSSKRDLEKPNNSDDILPRKTWKSSPPTSEAVAAAKSSTAADGPLASNKVASMNLTDSMAGMPVIKSYPLTDCVKLFLLSGSVTDFKPTVEPCQPEGAVHKTNKTFPPAAIVNAANKVCLGGAGVDGAISEAGGDALYEDRVHLPVVGRERFYFRDFYTHELCEEYRDIRVMTGSAAMTGPRTYGSLQVSYVIHAVGPDFRRFRGKEAEGLVLLKQAYRKCLSIASQAGLKEICFPALSAGIFRGYEVELEEALAAGVQVIKQYCQTIKESSLTGIYLCAFAEEEAKEWERVCNSVILGIPSEHTVQAHSKKGKTAPSIQTKPKKKPPGGDSKKLKSIWLQGRKAKPKVVKGTLDTNEC